MKKIIFSVIAFIIFLSVIEIFSTLIVHHKYRSFNPALFDSPISATLFIIERLKKDAIQQENYCDYHDRVTSDPLPLYIEDQKHGYKPKPGLYAHFFKSCENKEIFYKSKVLITPEGRRYVGNPPGKIERKVHIFGDSFVFGEGVNDEQTFTYLLQNGMPSSKFYLHAAGGWSLSNALINFEQLKGSLSANDVIVLGYAGFYKIRHVAAPSRLRQYGNPGRAANPYIKHVRISMTNNKTLSVDYVPVFCIHNQEYCSQPDPPSDYIDSVTAAIINTIAEHSKAKVYLFHFDGSKSDPVLKMLNSKVKVISSLGEDFDYRFRDDIMGLDEHPGPFWHYAMFQKLLVVLNE